MRTPRLLLGLSTTLLAGLLVVPATAPAVVYPGLRQYGATLDLAGRIVISRHVDATRECTPGRAYTQVTTIDLEMGRPRPVRLSATPRLVATTEARTSGLGGARTSNEIEDFRTTSACPPEPPRTPPMPGPCGQTEGDVAVTLAGALENGKLPMRVVVIRRNGNQLPYAEGCEIPRPGSLDRRTAISPMPAPRTGLTVPLGVTGTSFRKLGRGDAVARTISFSGPCENVQAKTARARTVGPDGQPMRSWCKVTGSLWVRLKRTS
ncbi:hypothetical protein [Patulibacter defluvii]|uniref:hypothetical protein n=1 Tax=Patulibacter defluvii TaxID=3095358 RepID=UPI002A753013|nr:hypothetical protein [Patulibacter sp. DM4]